MKNREIFIQEYGASSVLQMRESELPQPQKGEIRIRNKAIGLNFIDVYFRTGLYPLDLPSGLGKEGAGVVEAIGEGVNNLQVGDRVAYAFGKLGAYSDYHCLDANRVFKLPESISFEMAAAAALKGCTAHYLLRTIYPVKKGDTILFYAAAGGVGTIACQWAKNLGANVIGVVGSEAKVQLAKENGCDHVLILGKDDIPKSVREITSGEGVPVVYDSLGASTFETSLKCLRRRGIMVSYGNATGAVVGVNLGDLAKNGSLSVIRPVLADFMATDEDFKIMSSELLYQMAGNINVRIGQTFSLEDASKAHDALESRKTTGSTILIP